MCIPEIVIDDMDFETRRAQVVELVDDDIFDDPEGGGAATKAEKVALSASASAGCTRSRPLRWTCLTASSRSTGWSTFLSIGGPRDRASRWST